MFCTYFDLRDKLASKDLARSTDLHWVREECDRLAKIRYNPPDPELAVFAVKGSRDLDGRGLAILKALMEYRERHALRLGRPHFRVIPDAALLTLAAEPKSDLREVRGLGMFARGRLAAGLRDAIKKGRAAAASSKTASAPRSPTLPHRARESGTAAGQAEGLAHGTRENDSPLQRASSGRWRVSRGSLRFPATWRPSLKRRRSGDGSVTSLRSRYGNAGRPENCGRSDAPTLLGFHRLRHVEEVGLTTPEV